MANWIDGLTADARKAAQEVLSRCHVSGEVVHEVDAACGCMVHRAWRTEVAERDRVARIAAEAAALAAAKAASGRALEALAKLDSMSDAFPEVVQERDLAQKRGEDAVQEIGRLEQALHNSQALCMMVRAEASNHLATVADQRDRADQAEAEVKRIKGIVAQV